jgi:hypothetical protein
MPWGFREGFFDFAIKREDLYALGFSGWSQFVQREVPSDHYTVVSKIQVLPVQAVSLSGFTDENMLKKCLKYV